MKRRELLSGVSAVLVTASGCVSTNEHPQQRHPSSTPIRSVGTCPPYNPDADETVCSHTVDTNAASVYLLPSQTVVEEPSETLNLTLHNDSSTELTFNPYSWTVMMQRESGWTELEQQVSGNGKLTVAPGETQTWTLNEVAGYSNESTTLDTGRYTAEISVPDPDGPAWITCVAVFRLA